VLRKTRLVLVLALVAIYAALWLETAVFGAPVVRNALLFGELNSRRAGRRVPDQSDWCRARAYAPFLVHVKYRFGNKPLNCGGGSKLCFWMFGSIGEIWQVSSWAS
jgi:hypothetical protein